MQKSIGVNSFFTNFLKQSSTLRYLCCIRLILYKIVISATHNSSIFAYLTISSGSCHRKRLRRSCRNTDVTIWFRRSIDASCQIIIRFAKRIRRQNTATLSLNLYRHPSRYHFSKFLIAPAIETFIVSTFKPFTRGKPHFSPETQGIASATPCLSLLLRS